MTYHLQTSPSASLGELREWSSTYRWIPIAGGFFTFALAFMAGTNDIPASFGTSVGSGALTLSQSAAFAFLMEVSGATIMGNLTVDVLQTDILKERPNDPLLMWGFMIAIIAATIWLAIATYMKVPVSSFLSIKGAIIGISITTEGLHSIYWKKFDSSSALKVGGVVSIVLSWIIAPLLAAAAAFILFSLTRLVLLRSEAARQRVLRALPFYYGFTVMVLVLFVIYRGSARSNFHNMRFGKASAIAGLSGTLAAVLVFIRFKVIPLSQKQYGCKDSVVGERPQKEDPPLPPPSESQPDNQEADSTHQELNAEEILRQFQDLRVLDTVYEVDEEEEADEPPPALVKCSSFLARPRVPLRQLLAQHSCRTSFSRLDQKRKLSSRQKIFKFLPRFSVLTFRHKIQYNQNTLVRHALAETFDINAERLFCFLQILIAGAFSFSHGSNELPSVLNPYLATIKIYKRQQLVDKHTNVWILAMGGFAASIGFATVGWRLVRCFGGHITYITPSRGFIAQISALMTVLIADRTGLPLSTEHIIIGAILGVGAADNIENVHWKLVITFVLMWIATLICTCGICAALYAFMIYSPAYVVE